MAQNTVAEIRANAGLTQMELAELSGVAQPNIAAYENGSRKPSIKMVERLKAAARPRPSLALARHKAQVNEIAAKHHAVTVKVFGSVARGDDRPGSDIDLLVKFAPGASMYDLIELGLDVEDLLGVRVDVLSEDGLREQHEAIRREARAL